MNPSWKWHRMVPIYNIYILAAAYIYIYTTNQRRDDRFKPFQLVNWRDGKLSFMPLLLGISSIPGHVVVAIAIPLLLNHARTLHVLYSPTRVFAWDVGVQFGEKKNKRFHRLHQLRKCQPFGGGFVVPFCARRCQSIRFKRKQKKRTTTNVPSNRVGKATRKESNAQC